VANGQTSYIHGDHLTSATNTTGSQARGPQRYYTYGETRGSGLVETPYRYTGQREEAGIGLYFYNARWYDPYVGRFVQPDTIVPELGNTQAHD
jgi:RHS repeat-associated protein